jgi:hypothetical protein
MKPISRTAIKKYFTETLHKESVRNTLEGAKHKHFNSPKMLQDYTPRLQIDNSLKGFPIKVAGFTSGCTEVHIAQWILVCDSEAKAVVRHEVAHLVQHYTHEGCKPHGKEFTEALKIVSPKTWRKDKHWHDSPEVEKARKECVNNPKKIYLT